MREAIGPGALHPATLVIDADEHIVAHGADVMRQRLQLRARLEVAREQDHAAGQRMRDAADIVRIELLAFDIEYNRARPFAGNLLDHLESSLGWEASGKPALTPAPPGSAIAKATA